MTKIRHIFSAIALFVAASAAAEIDLPTKEINGKVVYYYEVPAKETIYSITRRFNVSREELIRLNPSLIDGLRAGSTLIIAEVYTPEEEPEPVEEPAQVDEPVQVEKRVQVEEPVRVEQPQVVAVEVEETYPAETAVKPAVEEKVASPLQQPADSSDYVNVAAILPFMLNSDGITRNAQNQLNFYRGMLLALSELPAGDVKIKLTAIDSEASVETVGAFVASPDFQELDYIIAPSDSLSIETIATAADTTGATVLNMFAVKNDAHQRHESVLQANIPHAEMYDAAIGGFIKNFRANKILFLNATDIPADKQSFVSQLNTALVHNGIPWETIDYSGKLTSAQLADLPLRDYIFVPTSSSREALMKIIPALIEYKNANPGMNVRLFGFPEWVVLRGDIKENLHRLNAMVYSRFSTDLDGKDVEAVNNAYRKWFGSEPTSSFPDTMLLGYDTMAWIINSADKGIETPYRGLQNAFSIIGVKDGGDVNNALYFITFDVDGRISATTL